MRAKFLAGITPVIIMCVTVISAAARDNSYHEPKVSDFSPYSMMSFGVSFRLDEHTYLKVAPTYHFEVLRYISEPMGLVFGAEYNNSTTSKTDYRTVDASAGPPIRRIAVGTGVRYRFSRKIVSPFLEGNLQFHRYWLSTFNTGESKLGLNFGIGSEIRVSHSVSFDIYLNHTINKIVRKDYTVPDIPPPPGIEFIVPSSPPFSSNVYNPTSIRISIAQRI